MLGAGGFYGKFRSCDAIIKLGKDDPDPFEVDDIQGFKDDKGLFFDLGFDFKNFDNSRSFLFLLRYKKGFKTIFEEEGAFVNKAKTSVLLFNIAYGIKF